LQAWHNEMGRILIKHEERPIEAGNAGILPPFKGVFVF
jgi:hypothetical protein